MAETEIGAEILEGDGSLLINNQSGLPDEEVKAAISEQYPQIISDRDIATINEFYEERLGRTHRPSSLFGQNKYVIPESIFEQFKLAHRAAVDDDVVSNAVETTEHLAFKKITLESDSDNEEENNIWEQIKDSMFLEKKMRQVWRELFIISQCYLGVTWRRKSFKYKGKTEAGKKSKKKYDLIIPDKIIILDPCKIIPLANLNDDLLYIADEVESVDFDKTLTGKNSVSDAFVKQFVDRKYTPSESERKYISNIMGGSYSVSNSFYLLNKDAVFRITQSRPDYQRFADVRLLSVMTWLDLKHNLQELDRADVLGNINAIILVRKGSDQLPATQKELGQANAQIQKSSRLPIIVSDHRLEIEFVTRKTDHTLRPERYNMIDSRVTARLFQILQTGNYAAGTATDNSGTLFKIIASTMEARRDTIRDEIMDKILMKIYERNDALTGEPMMKLRRVALDFDQHWAKYVFDLFALDQISLTTALAEVDIDIHDEAVKRRREQKLYSDVFEPPVAPGTPGGGSTGSPEADGRIGGGNSNGGGTNQDSFTSSPKNGSGSDN